MGDYKGKHKTYRTKFDSFMVNLEDLVSEFDLYNKVLSSQKRIFENDGLLLTNYKTTLDSKYAAFADAYNGCIATLREAIDKGELTDTTFEAQEKKLTDKYNIVKGERLRVADLLYKHLSKWEGDKAKVTDDARRAQKDNGDLAAIGIRAKPETLKPDKLSMSATPLQFKHWKSDFLAYFRAINGIAGEVTQQQSFLRACMADEFREDLNFDNLPVSNPQFDDQPFDDPSECMSCLQRLTKYFLQRVPMIIRRFHAMRGQVNMNKPILDQLDRFNAEYKDTQMSAMTAEERQILAFLSRIPRNSELFHEIIREIHTNNGRHIEIGRAHV